MNPTDSSGADSARRGLSRGPSTSPLAGVDAIVLAGGLGTRLRSVVGETPKILAPVGGRPFLDLLLHRLAELGVPRVILSLGYRADAVVAHIKTHPGPIPVHTAIEKEPLGTAGGVRLAAKIATTDPVLVMNGDTWVEADYGAFLDSHRRSGRPCSILCAKVEDARAFGQIEIGNDGVIDRFMEKSAELTGPGVVSAGIYLFGVRALAALETTPGMSLEKDFFGTFAPGKAHGYVGEAVSFTDIGTPAGLTLAAARLAVRSQATK